MDTKRTSENMNRNKSLYIFRLLLVLILALVPFKAKGGSDKYAKVILHTDTAKGIVYFDGGSQVSQETVTEISKKNGEGEQSIDFKFFAKPKEGYKFAGWSDTEVGSVDNYENPRTVTVKSSKESESAITANETKEFYAHWTALTRYYARLNVATSSRSTGTGTIKINGSSVASSGGSGYGEGSAEVKFTLTAEPSDGQFFVGWEEEEGSGVYVSTSTTYECPVTATSTTSGTPTEKTIYAVFVNKRPSITIKINGSNYGSGDNIVFNVVKSGTPAAQYTVSLRISSSAQVTIKEVPFGTYSITPNAWGWNYTVTPVPVGSNTGVPVNFDTTFEFNVVGESSSKEYDEKTKVNWAD